MNTSRHGLLAVVLLGMASLANAGPVRALLGQGAAAGTSSMAIAAGFDHTCELIGDGNVRCWGNNQFGQLGNGVSGVGVNSVPVKVSNLTDAIGLSSGQSHVCALKAGGLVACWGQNGRGQLGDGTSGINRPTPTLVAGLTNAVAIAAGPAHSCALMSDGTARCWGSNIGGQLGNGATAEAVTSPVTVKGLSNAVALAAGADHTCALLASGGVSCWGANSGGQIGNGTTVRQLSPVAVVGLTDVVSIVAGFQYTCAHRVNGTVVCWGDNARGQLGDGTGIASSVPVTASGFVDPAAITAGTSHACVIRSDGTVRCWGSNLSGQLGDGTTASPRLTPVTVGGLTNAVALAAGSSHTCALRATGGTVCWGDNSAGQLGDGSTSPSLTPISAAITRSMSAVQLASGFNHNCAIRSDGTVACWGNNQTGQLGLATAAAASSTPVAVSGLSGAVALGAGGNFSCALRVGGTVSCWGMNSLGQLGRGTLSSAEPTPAPVSGLSFAVALADGSARHTCAVVADGGVRCWGVNNRGQLGDGTTVGVRLTPVGMNNIGNAIQVVVGDSFTCVLRTDGTVSCTGDNGVGQLGDGTNIPRSSLAAVIGLSNVVALAAGPSHACALRADGNVRCWGSNGSGQLGIGSTSQSSDIPVPVAGISGAVAITAQSSSTCALLADGTARCWGANVFGQLADGTTVTPRLTPVPVTQLLTLCNPVTFVCSASVRSLGGLVAITGGSTHGCALASSGAPWCWGSNLDGEVGKGTFTSPVTRASEVSSFRFNISPAVALRPPGRVATVTATLNCPEDQQAKVEVTLRQGSAVGHGIGMRKCAGGLDAYEFTVPAQGRESFVAGPAEAQAEAVVLDHGTQVDAQTWTRKVTVSLTP